jgi:succinate-acetate transporter protein
MKERVLAGTFVAALFLAAVVATQNTDLIYITLTVAFFLLCAAYAWACDRL